MLVCVGPLPDPITGQSIAFEKYVKNSDFKPKVFDTSAPFGRGDTYKLLSRLVVLWSYFIFLIKNEVQVLYITTSRTGFGFFSDAAFILLFKYICKGKVINHLHGADFLLFRCGNRFKYIIDFVYKKIDCSIVLTNGMAREYQPYGNMNIKVVQNFSEINLPIEIIDSKFIKGSNRKLEVLYMSNILYSKGVFELLDASESLIKSGFDFKIVFCGDFAADDFKSKSDIKNEFISRIEKLDFVDFLGPVKGIEKRKIFEQANIFCLPTFYKTEAQPISIFEAMGAGCVVVTTRHNFLTDYLNDDMVVFSEPRDSISLEVALKRVVCEYDKYQEMVRLNHYRVLEENTIIQYTKSIDNIIKETLR
ncbi:glycosyltransferase family 4 protein [Vibrio natriegens]|uniref:glycosyltransferase family 4 protein n=1 Tax=Vibrio natriegens TaxID=691 RepID=UPI0021E9272A|nr:glycosyltransferase family 4 protein [Vibrio natriegens]UYI47314.1 glycosyltransferase family 4 protein [Vibrio natriegens]